MFGKLLKATVAVALTPAAVVTDIVRMPFTAEKHNGQPFECTGYLFNSAAENVKRAIDPAPDTRSKS